MGYLYEAFKYATYESRKKFIQDYNAMNLEILRAYLNAGEYLADTLMSSGGVKDRILLQGYASSLKTEVDRIIKDYGLKAALTQLDYERIMLLDFLAYKGATTKEFGKELEDVVGFWSENSVNLVYRGNMYKDGRNLSSRIWKAANGSAKNIQDVIAMAEAQGMEAAELSELLKDYVNPSKRKWWSNAKIREHLGDGYSKAWKDLEYNALRLARTTISHIGTEAVRSKGKINPFAKKVQWHSVHAEGRTCQTCIDMDGEIFDIEKVPFDHPNGLCYQTVYFEDSLEEMADRLSEWVKDPESDEELEQWWRGRYNIFSQTEDFVEQK